MSYLINGTHLLTYVLKDLNFKSGIGTGAESNNCYNQINANIIMCQVLETARISLTVSLFLSLIPGLIRECSREATAINTSVRKM